MGFKDFLYESIDLSNEEAQKYYNEAKKLEKYPPSKTVKVYKIFKLKKTEQGKIFPLFIGSKIPTPLNKWAPAEFISTKGFKDRAGWHSGGTPYAPHLMKKDRLTMPMNRVWAECEIPNDYNWNKVLKDTGTKQLLGVVPVAGYYYFNTNKVGNNKMAWRISGALKVTKILTHEEADAINKKNGIDSNFVTYHEEPISKK